MTGEKLNTGTAVALGNFDGLHKGHMAVLESALRFKEKGYAPTVILFDVHPKEFLKNQKVSRLLTFDETKERLSLMGFRVEQINFSEIKDFTPEEFFEKVLIQKLNAKALCCGFNYSFGKNGTGNSLKLKALCESVGIECEISDEKTINSETVSSTQIRDYLINGEPDNASLMLGRNYSFTSEVIHGDQRGRELGFPTINQRLDESLVVPKYGVYETVVTIDGKKYKGVTNIGIRPTYLLDTVLSETNILDFNGDAYGKKITVELVRYLRGEQKFESVQKLISRLNEDVKQVTGND